jgi:hypothetical protein
MKAAIYVRVSTSDQTVENQILRLTEFSKSKGWEFEIFSEVMSTRKTRPVKAGLLTDLRNKLFDGVIVYKLDRWARSSTELILEISELTQKGIFFYSYWIFQLLQGNYIFRYFQHSLNLKEALFRKELMKGSLELETAEKY